MISPAADSVLLFSKTAEYRHDCIPAGVEAIEDLLRDVARVDATEDATVFTEPDRLARYRAVVFFHTSGTVLDAEQKEAFQGYVRSGGGFAAIHGAAASEYDWPLYETLLGARFAHHPRIQPAAVRVEDPNHPSTTALPPAWTHIDEWYDFRTNPRPNVHVLLTVDEDSYEGGGMGADHPLAWYHNHKRSRCFFTALGHMIESYADPVFRAHLSGGIRWAALLA